MCDYNFECLTRCCSSQRGNCTHFTHCVQECSVNDDCNTACCSLGYCSAPNLCTAGNKADRDYCDKDWECKSRMCKDHMCQREDEQVNQGTAIAIGVFVIVSAILITLMIHCICCKQKPLQKQPLMHSTSINRGSSRRSSHSSE